MAPKQMGVHFALMLETDRQRVLDSLDVLYAIEVLEIHDINYLTADRNFLVHEKRRLVKGCLSLLSAAKIKEMLP